MPSEKQAVLGRRGFLKAGFLSSGIAVAAASQSKSPLRQGGAEGEGVFGSHSGKGGTSHGSPGTVGSVHNEANGFDPHERLYDFDYCEVSQLPNDQTLREYAIVAVDKEIEVVPGARLVTNGELKQPVSALGRRCTR